MPGCILPCQCFNHTLLHRENNQNTYYVYKQIPVYMGGTPGTERIVIYSKKNGSGSLLQLQKFDFQTSSWSAVFQKEASDIPFFNVTNGYWEAVRQNVIVASYSAGSGGFLYYTVIGKKDGKVTELVNREEIFQGDVWLEDGKLFEQYSNRYRMWITKHRQLYLVPLKVPILPGAVVIRYSITPQGKVLINKKNFTVREGDIVQIIRTDLNDVTERLLYGYTPAVKFLKHKSGFKFLEKGMLEVTIIPEGYTWEKAVEIIVEAK